MPGALREWQTGLSASRVRHNLASPLLPVQRNYG
jgi:hypothetical protein